jgi:hypothetical protein
MQRTNLRTGLLAGVTVLALGGCSFFHHRDDRSDSASARPKIEQQGSSQQTAANNQPAQGAYGTSATPSGNGYAGNGAANADSYVDRGAGSPQRGATTPAPTGAGTPYANNSPHTNGTVGQRIGQSSATGSAYGSAQGTSGSSYPSNAPGDGSTGANGSPYANGAAATRPSSRSGSGSTIGPSGMSGGATTAPAQRGSPSAMNDATSPNGVQGDTPTAARGAVAGTSAAPAANGGMPANGVQQGSGTMSPSQSAQATGAPQPLMQNNTRNQMQNQLQNQTGLVDVNLNNVKVDVAKNLNIDASKIPVTVQLPVTAAANVCGVDVNALAAQKQQGGGTPSCMANNANEATQAVQTSVQ